MLSFYFLSEPSMTASYFNRRRNQKILFSQYGLCAALVLLWTITAQGAIYYVATTGNDTNPGTQDSPFLTIQKCVDIVVAGDRALLETEHTAIRMAMESLSTFATQTLMGQ